jgi:hypothetical protein
VDALLARTDASCVTDWYLADRHGFNNPAELWDGQSVEVLALGDSYTHGYCSPREDSIVGLVRAGVPRTITLGQHSTGPLRQLALFREYGERLKPRLVVWFYSEFDPIDLAAEADNPDLAAYLDPAFRVGLSDHQELVDRRLQSIVEARHRDGKDTGARRMDAVKTVVLLRTLRTMFGLNAFGTAYYRNDLETQKRVLPTYRRILTMARDTAAQWGGKVVMVHLPHPSARFLPNRKLTAPAMLRDDVLALWRDLGLDTVDLMESFVSQPDPVSLVFNPHSHYSEKGNALAAGGVLDRLRQLGVAR